MQVSDIQKVVTSSIVIVPPENLCGQIQDIRRLYDKSFERWMPHINLLYPFVPKNQFASVVGKIQTILKEIKPFKVRLDQFTHFEHRASTTVFLDPKVVVSNQVKPDLEKLKNAIFVNLFNSNYCCNKYIFYNIINLRCLERG
jgi:2'-5' RNA ligase